jgi:hypothetical protein
MAQARPTDEAALAPTPASLGHGPAPDVQDYFPLEKLEHRHIGHRGSPHGKPSSWALVAVIIAAFAAGGVALIIQLWPLFFVCVGIVGLSVPAGKLIGIMDDTVSWGSSRELDDPRSLAWGRH